MTSLTERSLPELLEYVVDNRGRSCPVGETGIPLIATNCLKAGKREPVFENVRYVDESTYSNWFRAHPKPGDVLFVCKGAPGRVAVVPDPVPFCIAQDMVALRANPSVADPAYLYYRLCSPDVRASIENMHVGTMIPHFKKGDFGKLRFLVHDRLPEQEAIAKVLGALDDKIAGNGCRGQILLDLADAEFSSRVRSVSAGDKTFGDVAEVGGGGTPKTAIGEFWNGDVSWATPTDLTGLSFPYLEATSRCITEQGLRSCASARYPAGSILMTSRATIGAFAIAQIPVAVNQGFIVVNANETNYQWWIFHEMRSRVAEFISHANGATFLELSRGKFKKFPVRLPAIDEAQAFTDKVGPIHKLAAQLSAETSALIRTRDKLLPLLMSGRICVKVAEKAVEEAI